MKISVIEPRKLVWARPVTECLGFEACKGFEKL